MIPKSLVKVIAVLAVAVVILGGCAVPQASVVPQPEVAEEMHEFSGEEYEHGIEEIISVGAEIRDELVIVVPSMPVSLDPISSHDNGSVLVRNQIFDSLISLNPVTQELEPGLAVSWEMEDAWTVHMELRRGVYFHNGNRFTASDVQFTFNRLLEAPLTRAIVEMIEYIEIHDDYNITIHLNEPFVPILNIFAANSSRIVNERAVLEMGDRFHERPIGTGPFKFEEILLGDRVILTRNDNFWGETSALREMTFRVIPEQANRFIEVETGNADIAIMVAPSDIPRAEATDGITLHRTPSFSYTYIGFNMQSYPLADIRVRHAINHALNTEAIAMTAFSGTGSPATGPLSSLSLFSVDVEPFEFDVERALELMAQAGYSEGFRLSVATNAGNQVRADIAEMVQNQLRAINIDVTIDIYEHAIFLERTAAGYHDMFVFGTTPANPDPNTLLYSMFHSSMFGAPGNRMFYYNPEVDRLLHMGRAELDKAVRAQMYADVQHLIRDDAPQVFLHQGEEIHISRSNVRNFSATANGVHRFWQIYFEE